MNNLKSLLFFLITFLIIQKIISFDFSNTDSLHQQGKYQEELDTLKKALSENKNDASLIWRIGRAYFEIADSMPDIKRNEKINAFAQGMDFLKPYLNISTGEKGDRARIVHWYTANYASKANTIGALEALSIVNELFALADKALSIDPDFSDPYFVKARIDDRLPVMLGGDKIRMEINLSMALKYNQDDITVLVDTSKSFINRNWTHERKVKEYQVRNIADPLPVNRNDRDYAYQLLKKAISVYESKKETTQRDKMKYNEAKGMLAKWK